MSDYPEIYRVFIRTVEISMKRSDTNRYLYRYMRNEYRQMDNYRYEFRIACEHNLKTDTDLLRFKVEATEKLNGLLDERNGLRNRLRCAERREDPLEIAGLKEQISKLSGQIRDCRNELRAADRIAERSGIIKEKLRLAFERQVAEREKKGIGRER